MKCTIIQDLLPLYCDGLASSDSSEEIEKHIADCEKCREVYENMKTKEMNIDIPERDIKPLKKVKKRNLIKIIAAVMSTAAVLFGLFMFIFWGIVPISSDKVHYTIDAHETERKYQYTDSDSPDDENTEWQIETETVRELNLEFDTDTSCCRFSTKPKTVYINGNIITHQHLYIYPQIKLPFDDRGKYPDQFTLGFDVHEGDTLTIHYRDKEEEIDLYKLYSDESR